MVDWRWVSGIVVALSVAGLAAVGKTPAAPIVAGSGMTKTDQYELERLATLEANVGADPGDAAALVELVELYLARQAPGLAQAALNRAPPSIREQPQVAETRVRTLAHLGHVRSAYDVQSSLLMNCKNRQCPVALVGRGAWRARWLGEMVELGVKDAVADQALAEVAYLRVSREVRLAHE